MIVPVLLGIVGAAFLGTGFVVQQREAAQVASTDAFSVRLLWALMRRRLWWSGIAAMAIGYVLVGLSLGTGNLVLVEPLIAANLVFALPVAAAWCRRVPQRRSMLGAVGLAAGGGRFVFAGPTQRGAVRQRAGAQLGGRRGDRRCGHRRRACHGVAPSR